jgi:plastocyanin
MSLFKITINAGNPATFDPDSQTAVVNDSVFWFNADPKNAHWPAPSAAQKTAWLDFQIPPDSESSQISFNPSSPPGSPYTLNYVCALHPNETGQIHVLPGKGKKGAFGPKTKKGAFGRKTKKGAFGGTTR